MPVHPIKLETALTSQTSPFGVRIEDFARLYPLVLAPDTGWLNYRQHVWHHEGRPTSKESLPFKIRFLDPVFEQHVHQLMEGGHVIVVEENHPDDILMHLWFLSLVSQNNIVLHRTSSLGEAGSGTMISRARESIQVTQALGMIPMVAGGMPDGSHEASLQSYETSLQNHLSIAIPNRLLTLLHYFRIHPDQESRFPGFQQWRQKLDKDLSKVELHQHTEFLYRRLLHIDSFANLGVKMKLYPHRDHMWTEPIITALRPEIDQVLGLVEPTALVTNMQIKQMEMKIFALFTSQLKHIDDDLLRADIRYTALKEGLTDNL